jgi:hypothetical protein
MLGAHADEVRLRVMPETLALDQLAGAGGGGAGLGLWAVRVPAHGEPLDFSAEFTNGAAFSPVTPAAIPSDAPAPRWREEVATGVTRSIDSIILYIKTLRERPAGLHGLMTVPSLRRVVPHE